MLSPIRANEQPRHEEAKEERAQLPSWALLHWEVISWPQTEGFVDGAVDVLGHEIIVDVCDKKRLNATWGLQMCSCL